MALIELVLSKEVAGGAKECDTYVPLLGKAFEVKEFHGEGAFDANCAVELIWVLDHVTEPEEPIWTIKGSSKKPEMYKPRKTNADGVRKLGLCLDNGLAGPVYMSGYALIWVED